MPKNTLNTFHTISGASMTGTATVTSAVTSIQNLDNIAIQLVFTGTPNGTFSVLGSLDYTQGLTGVVTNAGTWTPLTLSPAPVASGAAGNILINLGALAFPWIKITYTNTSSTGTLDGYISGKAV